MSEQELAGLVEKIVVRVMERMQSDAELAPLVKSDDVDKSTWARTCSTYRQAEKPIVLANPGPSPDSVENTPVLTKKLYTERDIIELAKAGNTSLVISKKTIITPLARDAAKSKGIKFIVE